MTRDQLADDLMTLVVRIGNELPALDDDAELPADVRAVEWAYVKGLASGEIMRLRDRVLNAGAGHSLSQVTEQSGPSRRKDREQP